MQMILSSLLTPYLEECVRRLFDLERSHGEEGVTRLIINTSLL